MRFWYKAIWCKHTALSLATWMLVIIYITLQTGKQRLEEVKYLAKVTLSDCWSLELKS